MSSFYDNDKLEKQENYSGKRIKRGLYLTKNNIEVNADINASLNILRKSKNLKSLVKEEILILIMSALK